MKRAVGVIIFSVIVIALVGIVVMLAGNKSPAGGIKTVPGNTGSGQNSGALGQNNSNSSTTSSTTISLAELAKHNSQSDCWISYKNKVYDITSWLPVHPGSAAAIAPYCGTSTAFEKAFTDKHGTSQVGRLMKVGNYKGELA